MVLNVYVYSIHYKTGNIKERYGRLDLTHTTPAGGFHFHDANNSGRLTNVAGRPGLVRGSTVWYLRPNPEGAKEAFAKKAEVMEREYLQKFMQSYGRRLSCTT